MWHLHACVTLSEVYVKWSWMVITCSRMQWRKVNGPVGYSNNYLEGSKVWHRLCHKLPLLDPTLIHIQTWIQPPPPNSYQTESLQSIDLVKNYSTSETWYLSYFLKHRNSLLSNLDHTCLLGNKLLPFSNSLQFLYDCRQHYVFFILYQM